MGMTTATECESANAMIAVAAKRTIPKVTARPTAPRALPFRRPPSAAAATIVSVMTSGAPNINHLDSDATTATAVEAMTPAAIKRLGPMTPCFTLTP